MEDLIKQSAANLRGNKGKKLDSEGNEVVRYFKASTLAGYCTQLIQLASPRARQLGFGVTYS